MTIFNPSEQLALLSNELEYQQVKAAMDLYETGIYSTAGILKALDPVIRMLATELNAKMGRGVRDPKGIPIS